MSNHILNLGASEFDGSDKSFSILRTNPKISTNVKLVVDSMGDIFLSSFDANRTLSDSRFKKFPVNYLGEYSKDISNFFNGVSLSEIFETKREYSDLAAYSDYSFQYEDTYVSGVASNTLKVYGEQYKIFAPIWLNKKIPSKFVIYRSDNIKNDETSQNTILNDILHEAEIVKVFDLSKESKIGTYLHNHNNHDNKVKSPLNVTFGEDSSISYNGIDVVKGGFVKKIDDLHRTYISRDNTEIHSNSITTSGFEKNGIASSDLINLEFMFDDSSAEEFKIYRYFGLFVDEVEEGSFSATHADSMGIHVDYDTVLTSYDLEGTNVNEYDMIPNGFDISIPMLNYVKDINDEYYHVKNKSSVSSHNIPIGDVNLEDFKGLKSIKDTLIVEDLGGFHGYIKITVDSTPTDLDRLMVAMKQDLMYSSNNSYDSVTDKATYNFNEFTMLADSSVPVGEINGNKFSSQGSVNDIATAITLIIKNILPSEINVIRNNNEIIIEDYGFGFNRSNLVCGVYNSNFSTFTTINGKGSDISKYTNIDSNVSNTQLASNWNMYTLDGGAEEKRGMTIISNEVGDIKVDNFIQNEDSTYTKVIGIVKNHSDDNYRLIFDKDINTKAKTLKIYESFKPTFGKFDAYDIKDFDFDFYNTDRGDIGELKNEVDSNGNVKVESNFWNVTNRSLYAESSTVIITKTNKIDGTSMDTSNTPWVSSASSGAVWNSNGWVDVTVEPWNNPWNGNTVMYAGNFGNYIPGRKYSVKFRAKFQTGVLSSEAKITVRHAQLSVNNIASAIQLSDDWQTFSFEFTANSASDRLEFLRSVVPSVQNVFSISDVVLMEYTPAISDDPLNIGSEYDRLSENTLKEHAVESRVSPDILKFGLMNGTDSRNMPYLLNVNPSMGPDNMSPNIVSTARNPLHHNLEYFNMVTITDNAKNNGLTGFTSYTDECGDCDSTTGGVLTIEKLKSTETDYFSRYFKYDGYYANGVWRDDKRTNLYTIMDGGDNDNFSSSVFKGLRYLYQDRKETELEVPTEFINNGDVNGYKISTVLRYISNSNIESNNTSIEVIKNDKFKFICTYITVNVVNNDLSDINISDMYSLDDITLAGNIVNSYLGDDLHFDVISAYSGITSPYSGNVTLKATDDSINNGLTNFTKKITKNEFGEYSYLLIFNSSNSQYYAVKVVSVIDDNTIVVSGFPKPWDAINGIPSGADYDIISSIPASDLTYTYHNAGDYGFNELFNTITAGSFADRFNKFRDVKYTRIDIDGNETSNDFAMKIESGSEFIKPVLFESGTDTDRPKSYALHRGSIGNVLNKRADRGYYMVMRRMNGNYMPIFTDIVNFTDIYNSWNIIDNATIDRYKFIFEKFKGRGVAFEYKGSYEIGFIPNYFFHKVNDENSENILKLSVSSDKLPLYPVINEIAIDKKKFNILKSKYDKDYFTRSSSDGTQTQVDGTLSQVEKKSFLSSTIMKVNDEYELMSYDSTMEDTLDLLDKINEDGANSTNVHWFEDDDRIFADFYVSDILLSKLKEDGISDAFSKYVNLEGSQLDKLKLYVEANIVPQFILDSVDMYMIESKSITTGFESMSSEDDVEGYTKVSNFSIQSINDGKLGFRFIFNKKPNYKYKFKTIIKIKA